MCLWNNNAPYGYKLKMTLTHWPAEVAIGIINLKSVYQVQSLSSLKNLSPHCGNDNGIPFNVHIEACQVVGIAIQGHKDAFIFNE